MCFHTKQTADAVKLSQRFSTAIPENPDISSSYFISFTHPRTPVIINTSPQQIQLYHWGLIPRWSKDKDIQQYTLNAKIETLAEKPSFKYSMANRCLIIATGFMEWQWLDAKGKQKQKYLITIPNDEPFAMAGLWNTWLDKTTGELVDTYTMITTEANELMSRIHNIKKRMPVILTPENENKWLQGNDIAEFKKCDIHLIAEAID